MNGTIDLLNVGDGDAIIISLNKDDKNLIVVIDGGEERYYKEKVKPALEILLQEQKKSAPDIVVATHFDSDHIGGLRPLISDYIQNISEVWVHPLPTSFLNESINIQEDTNKKPIIESIRQLNALLELIPFNKVKHVYNGYHYTGWSELKVLGPTEDFYKKLFPNTMTLEGLINVESKELINENNVEHLRKMNELMIYNNNTNPCPCLSLKTKETAKLTPTNQASIIISIVNDDKKFLFTGDAGITSFMEIPNWKEVLANIHWLKIPHHGSENNISSEIIDVMRPRFADNSGNRFQNDNVLKCIKKHKGEVRSTKEKGDLKFFI